MKVKNIMTQPVITTTEQTSLQEVARIMLENGIGGIPVINSGGDLIGIVTESDFTATERCLPFSMFRAPQLFGSWLGSDAEELYARARRIPVSEVMNPNVITVTEDDSIEKVLELILEHDINRVPVIRDQKPVGVVARRDLLRLMQNQRTRSK